MGVQRHQDRASLGAGSLALPAREAGGGRMNSVHLWCGALSAREAGRRWRRHGGDVCCASHARCLTDEGSCSASARFGRKPRLMAKKEVGPAATMGGWLGTTERSPGHPDVSAAVTTSKRRDMGHGGAGTAPSSLRTHTPTARRGPGRSVVASVGRVGVDDMRRCAAKGRRFHVKLSVADQGVELADDQWFGDDELGRHRWRRWAEMTQADAG